MLVVDDDDLQRRFLAALLDRAGVAHLYWANNGRTALEMFRRGPQVDVVVCDLLMPEMDGQTFLTLLHDEGHAPSVVIASGADSDTRRDMEETAAVSASRARVRLAKPVSLHALVTLLRRHRPASRLRPRSPDSRPELHWPHWSLHRARERSAHSRTGRFRTLNSSAQFWRTLDAVRATARPPSRRSTRSHAAASRGLCVAMMDVSPWSRCISPQQVVQRLGRRLVEIAGRLVRQQQPRAHDQRPCDGDALLLAARQRPRPLIGAVRQADAVQQFPRALAASPLAAPAMRIGISTFSMAENSGSRWWN